MTRKRFIVSALGVLLLSTAVFLLVRLVVAWHKVDAVFVQAQTQPRNTANFPVTHGSSGAEQTSSPTSAASGHSNGTPRNVAFTGDLASMPVAGLPLQSIVSELRRLSDSGSARASCRLAQELNRCALLPSLMRQRQRVAESIAGATPGSEQSQRLSALSTDIAERERNDSAICVGFQNTDGLNSWEYMFRAASAGYEPAMVNFATLPPVDFSTLIRQPEALIAYYEHSDRILGLLAERGNRIAIMSAVNKALGQSFWSDIAGSLTTPEIDYPRAALYANAGLAHNWEQNFFRRKLDVISKHLTPEQMLQAKVQADKLVNSWDKSAFDEKKYSALSERFAGCD